MLSFSLVGEILDHLADNLPDIFYRGLNGGIILLPGVAYHQESSPDTALYIIGEYRYDPRGLGRYIVIHYGSFMRAYGQLPFEQQVEELRRVLLHEMTHHLQSMGGTRELEKEDESKMDNFRFRRWSRKQEENK
ncbi:MAG: hypothetical protein FWF06_06815 [Symbiobacteriaceae bacterium]|nr:hypothetical protein [Symbiobacteriaceae bacterium]